MQTQIKPQKILFWIYFTNRRWFFLHSTHFRPSSTENKEFIIRILTTSTIF